ncbi:MAG: argininosuccinate lyase [Deltaproteobacteria bacterium]|nr:argininosuccinate lyase [Deltaproteobacteria bacterium]
MPKQRSEEYRGFRTAGIRLTEELLPTIVSHRTDKVLAALYAVHAFDKAHLVMLTEEALIPRRDGVAMLRALRDMERDGIEQTRLKHGGGIHSAENYLIHRLGEEVGGRIHLGRSSGDLNQTYQHTGQRDRLLEVMDEVNGLRSAVLPVAQAHLESIMPGYTHGQHGQPISLGFYLAMWAAVLERDFERLLQAYRRVNVSPTGAAIMTGSNFRLNRERTAELLGFDRPASNALDVIHSHDRLLESFCVLAILNSDLGRWAEDLVTWSTSEFAMADFPDRFCGTSSIMMQKKNPYAFEFAKGQGANAVGEMVKAFIVEKGPTGWAIQDRTYAVEGLWRVFTDTVRDLRWFREILPEIRWNTELMRERAGRYWAQATDVAGALVAEKSLPWRTTHQIVGILVRLSYERGFTPAETTPALLDEAAIEYMGEPVGLSSEALRRALDPANFVASRTLIGGAAPGEVRRQLAESRARLGVDEKEAAAARQNIQQAAKKLEAAIDALVGS